VAVLASPKKLQKKQLILNTGEANFEVEKKKSRPLSPFTRAGALRRLDEPKTAVYASSGRGVSTNQ